jgi:hypothetical protein
MCLEIRWKKDGKEGNEPETRVYGSRISAGSSALSPQLPIHGIIPVYLP